MWVYENNRTRMHFQSPQTEMWHFFLELRLVYRARRIRHKLLLKQPWPLECSSIWDCTRKISSLDHEPVVLNSHACGHSAILLFEGNKAPNARWTNCPKHASGAQVLQKREIQTEADWKYTQMWCWELNVTMKAVLPKTKQHHLVLKSPKSHFDHCDNCSFSN